LPAATNTRSEGRTSGPRPNPTLDTFLQQSAEIDRANAGVDALGNFTGDTTSPFNVVAP